jgi:hypothetical protein
MKTLLRHTASGLFFQSSNTWTDNVEQAYDFRFIDRALHYVKEWGLDQVELAFVFDEPQSVTIVSLERTELQYAAA